MKERRKFPRYKYSYKVLYKKAASLLWKNETYTENVSRGGIKIKIKRLLEEGTILKLKIFNPNIGKPIRALARILWTKKGVLDSDVWSVGLIFTHIGWTDTDKLLESRWGV